MYGQEKCDTECFRFKPEGNMIHESTSNKSFKDDWWSGENLSLFEAKNTG